MSKKSKNTSVAKTGKGASSKIKKSKKTVKETDNTPDKAADKPNLPSGKEAKPRSPRNPFLRKQFITPDNAVSVMTTDEKEGDKITQTVTHYEKVSKEQALDIFCDAIKEQLQITSGGIQVFKYLYSKVQASAGLNAKRMSLLVDKADCMREAEYTSIQSVFNGINELISKGIITKTGKMNMYFLNPNFFRPADFLIVTEYYRVNEPNKAE